MSHDLNEKTLVLASASPRRREIIQALYMEISMVNPGGEEGPAEQGETPGEYVVRLSQEKARRASECGRGGIVLGADTAVVLDGDILGKPSSAGEATRMLERLRGRTHSVITGITLLDSESGEWASLSKSSEVAMREYSDAEVEAYVASGQPFDKAGAYAAQDLLFRPARHIAGCYLNVVGLPLCEVVQLLGKMGVQARLKKGWHPPEECRDCPLTLMQQEVIQV